MGRSGAGKLTLGFAVFLCWWVTRPVRVGLMRRDWFSQRIGDNIDDGKCVCKSLGFFN